MDQPGIDTGVSSDRSCQMLIQQMEVVARFLNTLDVESASQNVKLQSGQEDLHPENADSANGGHVDPGEDDLTTAWRETKEETGFPKKALSVVPDFERTISYVVRNENKTVVYWLAELINYDEPLKLSKEHSSFKWATIEEACHMLEHADVISVFREAHDHLLKHKFGE